MKISKLLLRKLFDCFLSTFGFFIYQLRVHKNDRVLISQGSDQYNGNARHIFEFLCERDWDIHWLVRKKSKFENISHICTSKYVNIKSLKAIWLTLTCDKVIISHGGGDFGLLWGLVKHKKVINVWHGTGIKCLGLLDESVCDVKAKRLLEKETKYYDAVTVASDTFRYLFSSSYGIDVRKIHVTGDARTDIFLEKVVDKEKSQSFRVLYSPTFRDYKAESDIFFPFCSTDHQISLLINECKDAVFYLRPHPNDLHSVNQAERLERKFPDNIICFDASIVSDIDSVLYKFDLVISDYSSIHFEPLLSNTSLLFVPFDSSEYFKYRGLAFNYDLVTPGPKVDSLEAFIKEIKKSRYGQPEWKEKREMVKKQFFKFTDKKSRYRIENIIEKI